MSSKHKHQSSKSISNPIITIVGTPCEDGNTREYRIAKHETTAIGFRYLTVDEQTNATTAHTDDVESLVDTFSDSKVFKSYLKADIAAWKLGGFDNLDYVVQVAELKSTWTELKDQAKILRCSRESDAKTDSSKIKQYQKRGKTNQSRPNTGVPDSVLSSDIILCCGEDAQELLLAVEKTINESPAEFHEYRCYRFWKYSRFTLVWTGIGTGCLEPLLWETLDSKIIRRIVLIGTAGLISNNQNLFGKTYIVEHAYTVSTAIQIDESLLPLTPIFAGAKSLGLAAATAISTDYYYGFSQRNDQRIERAKLSDQNLHEAVVKHWREGHLIEMETAQFYHLASIYGDSDLSYIALRGVANLADSGTEQIKNTALVLTETARSAVALLNFSQTANPESE